ncbi:sugar phosphorylase [Budviciaceae bacterium BWR-B9]|uniref:Sugar phosphorylase n=1 Tax=Limnobaculum allomyrinae TaxID=2791986 RepID=A0ABS1IPZ5_9GAMM|nr:MULTISPECIES: alpha-amylase family glycosyl hydrolase [Limnobaculum]MBK5143611.1 sugar phosphorylase [Limnobaculum allomyrinae]MBV7692627.1 sugar phosphorylase [Limnobaculum sp. M2-1]
MNVINSLLSSIYNDSIDDQLTEQIHQKIIEAKNHINHTRKQRWDEKDVVLITYADQFYQPEKNTLTCLTDFYNAGLSAVFNIVHLLPFYPYSSDDGFSVIDYYQVNPIAGDWQDIAKLHRSTRLMFDYVCNHMSAQSEWFRGYLAQQPEYDDFFVSMDPGIDLSAVTRPRTSPLLTPFTLKDGSTRHIWTTFSADQIDLNFANPKVLIAMLDVLLEYLKQGADYIRLDAVGFMWKTPGTRCLHLEKTHQLVKLFRAVTDIVAPGCVIITETNVPHQDNIAYFGNGHDEAQMVYQFPLPPLVLHAIHTGSAHTLRQWATSLDLNTTDTTFFNFLASHDGIGLNPLRGLLPEEEILSLVEDLQREGALVSYKNNPDGSRSPYEINVTYMDALNRQDSQDDERIARFLLAHAILLAFPGVPAIYIQSILGSRNDNDGVKSAGHNRAINRQKYSLDDINQAIAGKNYLRHQIFHRLSQLIEVRKGHPAFHPNSPLIIHPSPQEVLAFSREAPNGKRVMALFNLSPAECPVDLPAAEYINLLTAETLSTTSPYVMQPYQFLWLNY